MWFYPSCFGCECAGVRDFTCHVLAVSVQVYVILPAMFWLWVCRCMWFYLSCFGCECAGVCDFTRHVLSVSVQVYVILPVMFWLWVCRCTWFYLSCFGCECAGVHDFTCHVLAVQQALPLCSHLPDHCHLALCRPEFHSFEGDPHSSQWQPSLSASRSEKEWWRNNQKSKKKKKKKSIWRSRSQSPVTIITAALYHSLQVKLELETSQHHHCIKWYW